MNRQLLTLSVLLWCGSASAAFVSPDWQRGIEGSAYLEWDTFTGTTNTSPDVGSNHISSAVLTDQIGQSFVTSSGNLYSFSSSQSYTLSVITGADGPSPIDNDVSVRLQIGTWTHEVADRLVTLNGAAGDVTVLSAGETTHPVFGTYTRYEYLFEWNVAASSVYQFAWELDETSTSLDGIVLDMYADGEVDGLLAYPLLSILPVIPGSALFDGRQLYPEDLLVTAASPVPLPPSLPLMACALLGLAFARRR